MKPGWVIRPGDARADALARQIGVHPVVASVLLRRGLDDAPRAAAFLEPKIESLESPFAFDGMQKAVERIRRAIAQGEKILLYGDYDVDGVAGSAVLYPVLKSLGAEVQAHIPHRVQDGYGLNAQTLERLEPTGFSLLITVDNGITAVEEVSALAKRGVDTIIVDHHLPKDQTPPAHAIVSVAGGHREGGSPLAACGVAWKLAWALAGDVQHVIPYLDLVVLGTLADLAPVSGDNRVILRLGLEQLRQTRRPGILALMDEAGLDRRWVSPRDVSFGLAPRINASGRMGSPLTAFKLLTTSDRDEARMLARLLEEGNKDRQKVEETMFKEAARLIEQDSGWTHESVLVVSSASWHEGVMGIVAARLCERFHKPAVVIAERDGMAKGSGRTVPGVSIHALVDRCREWLTTFGGHDQACGLSLPASHIAPFRQALAQAARQMPAAPAKSIDIEAELQTCDLTADLVRQLQKLEPFGPDNPKPVFVTRGMRLKRAVQKRGRDTLVGWATDGDGRAACELVGFRCYERFIRETPREQWSFAYKPSLKTFSGIESIQLELVDWA